jgi:hypothetical protein
MGGECEYCSYSRERAKLTLKALNDKSGKKSRSTNAARAIK